jgi:hypothetical protein
MRYFLGFLAAIGLIVLVFILVLRGFSGGGKPPVNKAVLSDYTSTETVMQLTLDGPVNADQNHERVRITIGRTINTIEIMKGYENKVVDSRIYPNNEEAYGNFLRSLQLLGYTKGNADPKFADERGACPLGQRYVYEIVSGDASVQRFWNTSCNGGGTFTGAANNIRTLFKQQIPDYSQLTRKLTVN